MLAGLVLLCTTGLALDYYETLGVSPDADLEEINKAFRTLSKQYHPDKNRGNNEAHQKYLDVTKAHDALSDSRKRQVYDIYGEEGLLDSGKFNLRQGPSYRFDLEVDLEDVYLGTLKETSIRRNELCPKCKGTGAKDRKVVKCAACDGKGVRMQNVGGFGFKMQMQVDCNNCRGRGFVSSSQVPGEKCRHCSGKRVVNGLAKFKVQVEAGMDNGSQVTFSGQSEQNPDWFPGDIHFVLKVKKHPRFERRGNDLFTKVRLSLSEALLGYTKEIAHLDGHIVRVEYTGVTQPGAVRQVREEGMPHYEVPSNKGSLFVEFIVDLPKRLTKEQQELVDKHF